MSTTGSPALIKVAIKSGLQRIGLLSLQESLSKRIHDTENRAARLWIRGLPALKALWMERSLARYYSRKQAIEWYGRQAPLWYDHRTDLHTWNRSRNPQWVERGVYAREVMPRGCSVLDLCCADGFYAHHFYSVVAGHIDAVDFNRQCIRRAQAAHADSVIEYHCMDALSESFPRTAYDVVTWDASIQYFDLAQIHILCAKIAAALGKEGILSGSAKVADHASERLGERCYFNSADELRSLLREHFPHVAILETAYPERTNLYFRCSFSAQRLGGFVKEEVRACR